MKKNLTLGAGVLLATLTAFVHASDKNKDQQQKKNNNATINPAASPYTKGGADVFIIGELLYWQATEKGLPLGVVNKTTTPNLNQAITKSLHGKWDLGMRIAAGYVLPHDGWDLSLTWLHFNPSAAHRSLHRSATKLIFPTLAASADPMADLGVCRSAKGHWKLSLNQLDLDMGREFFVSRWLTLRPHFGLRADRITQKLTANYRHFLGQPEVSKVYVKYKDKWWGIGPEGGLDTQWGLGCGWSIFADVAVAVLYGKDSVEFKDIDTPAISNVSNGSSSLPDGVFAKVKDRSTYITQPVLDFQLGLRWDWLFNDDAFHLGLQAGWENHIYFDQNQFPNFSDDYNFGKFFANQGNLTLQGLTVGVRLDF